MSAKTIIGKHGYLFLSNDSNGLLDQHQGNVKITDTLASIYSAHLERAFVVSAWNGHYLHMVAPNKETVARDFLPEQYVYEVNGPTPVRQYLNSSRFGSKLTFFEPEVLGGFYDEYLYYRTDSHWTSHGALLYFATAFRRHGFSDYAEELERLDLLADPDPLNGDLGNKIGIAAENAVYLRPRATRIRAYFSNNLSNEGCIRHFRSPSAPINRKLLIVHDSFGSWVVPLLPEVFREVLFVHTGDVDMNLVDRYRPDIMVMCQAERFFIRPTRNDSDYKQKLIEQESRKHATSSGLEYLLGQHYL